MDEIMPTINLNKNVFEKLVGKKLTLDKLKDRISMLGTDLESIEGNEIIVEVFPNRPDMLSEQGFARAFSSFIGVEKGLRNYTVKKNNKYVVKIEDAVKKVRPYTACAIVKGLKLDDEKINGIIQIQEKLHVSFGRNRKKLAIGIYPLEEIKLPITYTAKKPKSFKFLPLEGKKEMDGLQILSQH
ncbi:phenylalanine--tRNA ligase subunit beta, partial [Candidatus Woesearchaeota archaeon]|nr:phenylalanine--tRNA ligase subunit beta [Candidatus Woesearchaeota archaeon]